MPGVHEATSGGKGGDPPAALDLSDRAAVRAWLADLRTQVDDLFAAAEDATRPLGRRALGRPTARAAIRDAKRAIDQLAALAEEGAS
jgi:hypothetical protein